MKILQLGKAYPPANLGGVEVVIQLLNEGLNDAGISCDVLGVNDVPIYIKEKYKQGIIYRAKLLTKKFSTLFSIQLIFILKKIWRKYDIITIHSPDPMSCLALWIVRPKCKIVLYWHSDILRQKILLKFYKPFLNWLIRRADLILASSPNYIEGSKYLLNYRSKCEVLPIGVDTHSDSPAKKGFENRFSKFEGVDFIFSLGRLAYYKGYEYLVLAANKLINNAVIIIAGEGEEHDKLLQLIRENDLQNKVYLVGKITDEEKQYLFKHAKLFVLSSIFKTEAYAIVQVEALSFGLPIVSTQIEGSGVSWVNQNNVTGISVPIKDSDSIAFAINKLLNNEKLYNEYSDNALKRYQDLFTRKKMIDRANELYIKVLK